MVTIKINLKSWTWKKKLLCKNKLLKRIKDLGMVIVWWLHERERERERERELRIGWSTKLLDSLIIMMMDVKLVNKIEFN